MLYSYMGIGNIDLLYFSIQLWLSSDLTSIFNQWYIIKILYGCTCPTEQHSPTYVDFTSCFSQNLALPTDLGYSSYCMTCSLILDFFFLPTYCSLCCVPLWCVLLFHMNIIICEFYLLFFIFFPLMLIEATHKFN